MENKEEIILFGIAKVADLAQYYLDKYSNYKTVARCVDKKYITENTHNGLPVVDFMDIVKLYPPDKYKIGIPFSYTKLNKIREEKYLQAKKWGYKFISFISPASTVETEDIGENVFVFGQCHIQPFTKIGNNCIIWSGTEIGHETIVEDNCFITGATIASLCKIENNCFIGHSSAIRDGVTIGKYSVIGMASVILKNVPEASVTSVKQTKRWPQKSFEFEDILN